MSQTDMQHQGTVDGGASATDGYSPAARLLDLPQALLDDIACRVMQLQARSLLPLTCRAFSQARLLHVPALRIQLGRQCCDQLLTPRVVAALQARTRKLALTLWQPETEDSTSYRKQLAPTLHLPQTEYTQNYTDLLAHALAKLDNCAAVEVCNLVSSGTYDLDNLHLHCPPGLAQQLLDSFPSLTALTLQGLCVSSDALASLLSHPPLALQLQQLHLTDNSVPDGDAPGAVAPLLEGLQLKQLSIAHYKSYTEIITLRLPSFQPLAQHLTQLHLVSCSLDNTDLSDFMKYLQPLAELQVLTISNLHSLEGLTELLKALPQLHTLQLPGTTAREQDMDPLLAATQLTSVQLDTVDALDTSYADAPCSWQRLELQWIEPVLEVVACLPLHSLTQPLVVESLRFKVEDILDPEVAAALHYLAQACKVPVQSNEVQLNMDLYHSTPTLQQQREDLAQLVALLQPLQRCCVGKVLVRDLHGVTTADILALAPLCRDCTHFELYGGSVEPSLEFWHQLVQLMPAVQKVTFIRVERCVSAAMHESLQLMAEQPWARWLDIAIHYDLKGSQPPACHYSGDELPACWEAGNWVKASKLKVNMFRC